MAGRCRWSPCRGMPQLRVSCSTWLLCRSMSLRVIAAYGPRRTNAPCAFSGLVVWWIHGRTIHKCTRFSFATSASVVAIVRVVLWMCITLLFLAEMIIAASEMEPAANDVTRAVACPASSSMRAASSAYSNFAIRTVCVSVPTVMPGFTWSFSLKIRSSPAMNLHWLPVEQRIQYKLLIQVYKALNGLAPEYITELLQAYVPTRTLRSAGAHLLLEPKTTTRRGARAFSKAAPVLWNTLPTTFKNCSFTSEF